MRELKLSTAENILVFMADATDRVTGKTGLTLTITASKAAAAFASITPTVTERVNGWYQLALTSSHTDTLGDLGLHITGTGADPADVLNRVIAMDKTVANTPAEMKAAANNVITAAVIADDAITAAKLAAACITNSKLANDAISATKIATDAITSQALAASAITEIQSGLATQASVNTIDDFLDTEIAAILAAVDTEVGALVTAVAAVQTDTNDIQDRLPAALDAGFMRSDMRAVDGSTNAAGLLSTMMAATPIIFVDDATFTPTTTAFETDQTADVDKKYTNQVLFGLTGANAGVTLRITAYAFTNSKVKLTVSEMETAPANGDAFMKMGRQGG